MIEQFNEKTVSPVFIVQGFTVLYIKKDRIVM